MKMMLVDDNLIELRLFEMECSDLPDFEVVASFSKPLEALEYVRDHRIDIALLDIDMPQMDGFELASSIREIRKETIIIFVTAHMDFAGRAMQMKADYIIFKPYNRNDVLDVLRRARLMKPQLEKRIKAHMFGKFDLYVDGERVNFKTKKAKELAALCICQRGGAVSTYEIIEKLWVGTTGQRASETSGYRKAIKALVETLREYHIEHIFERKYGSCRIAPEEIECDFYQLLDYDRSAAKAYGGTFLPEYFWSSEFKDHADEVASMVRIK